MNADTPTPERVAELAAGLRRTADEIANEGGIQDWADEVLSLHAAADALTALGRTSAPRMFPIQTQRGAKPHPLRIPWDIAELAYSVYAARYGTDQSLERLGQRGGFGPGEMDELLPDWRERCDALAALSRERDELRRLCADSLDYICRNDDGDPISLEDACWCTDTGTGIDGGDTLVCLAHELARAVPDAVPLLEKREIE